MRTQHQEENKAEGKTPKENEEAQEVIWKFDQLARAVGWEFIWSESGSEKRGRCLGAVHATR